MNEATDENKDIGGYCIKQKDKVIKLDGTEKLFALCICCGKEINMNLAEHLANIVEVESCNSNKVFCSVKCHKKYNLE